MKHNIVSQVCAGCGACLYPPLEVSDIGVQGYEEVLEAPSVEPEAIPTDEELAEINKAREETGLLPFASIDEWGSDYRSWAQDFRHLVRSRAQGRYDELSKGPPKVRGLQVVEEAKVFRVKGRRWKAIYEETEVGWRLKCPKCDFITLEWRRATVR